MRENGVGRNGKRPGGPPSLRNGVLRLKVAVVAPDASLSGARVERAAEARIGQEKRSAAKLEHGLEAYREKYSGMGCKTRKDVFGAPCVGIRAYDPGQAH
jgi:hypothetical protein